MRIADCLNHIVTGTMGSRIFGKARKQGLVYGLGSCLSNSAHNSSWDFDGEVGVENAPALFDLIHQELDKITAGKITDREIDAAQAYNLGRYQMGAQTVGQISDYYAESYFTTGEIDNYERAQTIVNSIKKEDIVSLALEYVSSGICALVAVSSCEKAIINELFEKIKLNQPKNSC